MWGNAPLARGKFLGPFELPGASLTTRPVRRAILNLADLDSRVVGTAAPAQAVETKGS